MGVLTRNGLTLYEIAGKYHLLKKSLLENFIFCAVSGAVKYKNYNKVIHRNTTSLKGYFQSFQYATKKHLPTAVSLSKSSENTIIRNLNF